MSCRGRCSSATLNKLCRTLGAVDQWSFQELIREAAERGLIAAVEPWIEYRYQRNMTAHVYNEEQARRVYASAQSFIIDAKALLAEVERRNVD